MVMDRLGPETFLDNCKISIAGDANPGPKENLYSVGIWFRLMGPAGPDGNPANIPSGVPVRITNNEIIGSHAAAGIGMGQFWPETPGFTAPRFYVEGNKITIDNSRCGTQPGGPISTSGVAAIVDNGSGNSFVDNDFTESGIQGKKNGDQVCILLAETTHDDLVKESGKFPHGTGDARFQVSDLGTNNRVAGLPANSADSKDRGIGQRLKGLADQLQQVDETQLPEDPE